jgi:hypothetical protein
MAYLRFPQICAPFKKRGLKPIALGQFDRRVDDLLSDRVNLLKTKRII